MKSQFILNYTLMLMGSLGVHAQQLPGKQNVSADTKQSVTFPEASQFANSKFSYEVIRAAEKTFRYDILANGELMIHIESIEQHLQTNNSF